MESTFSEIEIAILLSETENSNNISILLQTCVHRTPVRLPYMSTNLSSITLLKIAYTVYVYIKSKLGHTCYSSFPSQHAGRTIGSLFITPVPPVPYPIPSSPLSLIPFHIQVKSITSLFTFFGVRQSTGFVVCSVFNLTSLRSKTLNYRILPHRIDRLRCGALRTLTRPILKWNSFKIFN